jgi:hypothetical protein
MIIRRRRKRVKRRISLTRTSHLRDGILRRGKVDFVTTAKALRGTKRAWEDARGELDEF